MRKRIYFLLFIFIFPLLNVRCGEPSPSYTQNDDYSYPTILPVEVNQQESPEYLIIAVDEVTLLKTIGDIIGEGEFQLAVIAVNSDNLSAKLIYPGQGVYRMRVNEPLKLNRNFGIAVKKPTQQDYVYVHFIGIDNDKPPVAADISIDVALGLIIPQISQWLGLTTQPFSTIAFVASEGTGVLYDWVKEQDYFSEQGIFLKASDDWGIGTHRIRTADGGMEISYTVSSTDRLPSGIIVAEAVTKSTKPQTTVVPVPTSTPKRTQRPLSPTKTPTPRVNPTSTPKRPLSPTKTPTLRIIPTSTPVPTKCIEPQGIFRNLWLKYSDRLGCPRRVHPLSGLLAEQPFQNGHMFWSQQATLYIITYGQNSGTWQSFWESESPWKNGMPDVTCDPNVIRGFGGLWCRYPQIREKLGSPLDKERGFDNLDYIQGFQNGLLLIDSDGRNRGLAYILFFDEPFIREPY